MRFSDANYQKAFPREDKPKAQAPTPTGSVIEEAEKLEQPKKTTEPDSVIEDEPTPDEPDQEGGADGNE